MSLEEFSKLLLSGVEGLCSEDSYFVRYYAFETAKQEKPALEIFNVMITQSFQPYTVKANLIPIHF